MLEINFMHKFDVQKCKTYIEFDVSFTIYCSAG